MNVNELKEFRAKLVSAKSWCENHDFSFSITIPFMIFGLENNCANVGKHCTVPIDVFDWYMLIERTPDERAAMWNNSIAAIDARIAKGKK